MASASFLSVPFYNWFCKVTGYGGATNVAQKESDIISDKVISVRFDASLEKGLEWEVKPVQRNMTLNLGETGLAFMRLIIQQTNQLLHKLVLTLFLFL